MIADLRHFKRLAVGVDIAPILKEVDASPNLWNADTSRQRKIRVQRETRNIFLRSAKKPLPPGARNANDVHESSPTPSSRMFPQTLNYCESVARELNGQLGRVALVALQPRSRVYPHVDVGEYYRIRDRLHLVLRSAEGSPLSAEEETIVMREGELWAFDNKTMHSAENSSDIPRVHLIFDVLPKRGGGFYVYPSTFRMLEPD